MAIPITDTQGTKAYLVATSVVTTTAANIATAITTAKQIGCLQSLGDIALTRAVNTYTCMSSDESSKSSGSVSLGNQEISTLFGALDTTGQAELRAMWTDNTRRKLILQLNDNAGVNPTYIIYEIFLSGQTVSIQKDSAVMFNVTVEISSLPTMILAKAV